MSSGPTLLILFSIDKVILHALLRWFLASKCGGFPENVIDSERKRDGKAKIQGNHQKHVPQHLLLPTLPNPERYPTQYVARRVEREQRERR